MKMFFLIKEGIIGFNRARFAAAITVLTIALSLSLVGMFGILVQNISGFFQGVYSKIRLEVYFDANLPDAGISGLQKQLRDIEGVEEVRYISAETAMNEYKEAFSTDVFVLLEANPLPQSFRITLAGGYQQINNLDEIVQKIETTDYIEEVVYQEQTIRMIYKYFYIGLVTAALLGAAIFLISTLLIFNTIRLTIYARKTVIGIMRLVGATNGFIKAPFIIEGVLQGIIGSLIAVGILWLASNTLKTLFLPELIISQPFFGFLILSGTVLGLLGSYVSIGKYLEF